MKPYRKWNLCDVCYGSLIPDGQTTPCETCVASERPLVSASRRERDMPADVEGAILDEQEDDRA